MGECVCCVCARSHIGCWFHVAIFACGRWALNGVAVRYFRWKLVLRSVDESRTANNLFRFSIASEACESKAIDGHSTFRVEYQTQHKKYASNAHASNTRRRHRHTRIASNVFNVRFSILIFISTATDLARTFRFKPVVDGGGGGGGSGGCLVCFASAAIDCKSVWDFMPFGFVGEPQISKRIIMEINKYVKLSQK